MSLDLKSCSDGELAVLALAGRQAAYAEIMRRYRDPIYRLVRGHAGEDEEALDLVQECFATAFSSLGRYQPDRPFRPWLSRIAINKCRDWHRRRAVRRLFAFAVPLSDTEAETVSDLAVTPDVVAVDRQELERLWRAVADLPVSLREPLVLAAIEGLPYAEIASILAISEKAVETRIYRARAKLTEGLARHQL